MHHNTDCPTVCRRTTGNKPAKLIGASITVIGSKVYLFGGSLVAEPKIVSDLFVCDLETLEWEKVHFDSQDFTPAARCFHSADTWNELLVIFGGSGPRQHPHGPDSPHLFNDVQIFDPTSGHWHPSDELNSGFARLDSTPTPRHSHLSSVIENRLFVIGGVGSSKTLMQGVHVYDLRERSWVQQYLYPRHLGRSFSVAACADQYVHIYSEHPQGSRVASEPGNSSFSSFSPLAYSDRRSQSMLTPLNVSTSRSNPHLPYSTESAEDFPCNVHVYSNEKSTDVKRKLENFYLLPPANFIVHDRSSDLNNDPSPPFLQFPTGAILGTHLIVSGMYLGPTSENVEIWAFDLLTLTWSPVDPGRHVTSGSWTPGRLWRDSNKFLMFGDRNGTADDYREHHINLDDLAIIDLECFGIYQPPPMEPDFETQELRLFALEEASEDGDFEIICDDAQSIKCSRKLLASRWPWFNTQLSWLRQKAKFALETQPVSVRSSRRQDEEQPDPRITPHRLNLAEQYEVTWSLLRYFYTLSLHSESPSVLCRLLVLSTDYEIPRLRSLVTHAMHHSLSEETCDDFYNVATRCDCQSLQFRCRAFKDSPSYQPRGSFYRSHSQNSRNTIESASQASKRRSVGTRSATMSSRSPGQLSLALPPAAILQTEADRVLGPVSPVIMPSFSSSTEGADQNQPNRATNRFAKVRRSVFRWLIPSTETTRRRTGGGGRHHVPIRAPPRPPTPPPAEPKPRRTGGGGRHHVSGNTANVVVQPESTD